MSPAVLGLIVLVLFTSIVCGLTHEQQFGRPVSTRSANFSVVFPAASATNSTNDVLYSVSAAFGTTGRIATLTNPHYSFNVHCAGCGTARKYVGVLETVDVQAQISGCRYATNGGPFAPGQSLSPIIVNGSVMSAVPQAGFQCVGFLYNGSWLLGHIDPAVFPLIRDLMCGFEFLVIDGVPQYFKDSEIAPRTVFVFPEDGTLTTLVAEGSEVAYTGLTLNQTSNWAVQLGAKYAINMDGGGSSTSYWLDNGGVQGCPTCVDQPFCCSRAVSTILCAPPSSP